MLANSFLKFLLTRLMRGVTPTSKKAIEEYDISTHTPHARRDIVLSTALGAYGIFLLTRLMRGVTFEK